MYWSERQKPKSIWCDESSDNGNDDEDIFSFGWNEKAFHFVVRENPVRASGTTCSSLRMTLEYSYYFNVLYIDRWQNCKIYDIECLESKSKFDSKLYRFPLFLIIREKWVCLISTFVRCVALLTRSISCGIVFHSYRLPFLFLCRLALNVAQSQSSVAVSSREFNNYELIIKSLFIILNEAIKSYRGISGDGASSAAIVARHTVCLFWAAAWATSQTESTACLLASQMWTWIGFNSWFAYG